MKSVRYVIMITLFLTVSLTGCATRIAAAPAAPATTRPAVSRSVIAVAVPAGRENPMGSVGNPGTGAGDPALLRALLPQSGSAGVREYALLSPAVVALPDRDRGSLFIPLRQFSSPVVGSAACDGWTGGLWIATITGFNMPGVQLAVSKLISGASLQAAETIITGPASVLDSLSRTPLPAVCERITANAGYTGGVAALPAPRLGLGSRAFQVTGTGSVPVWQWAEVVRGAGFVLEIRIPDQSFQPSAAKVAQDLRSITVSAYQRAKTALAHHVP